MLLLWLLVVVAISAAIHFFENLPLQHYWNPRVRLLYPYRQWRLEKQLLKALYPVGAIPRHRLPPLPFEIWENILNKAIDIPFIFDTLCNSKYFDLFMAFHMPRPHYVHRAYKREEVRGYRESEMDRKRFRLVCKTWNNIVGHKKGRYVATNRKYVEETRRVQDGPYHRISKYSEKYRGTTKNITSIIIYSSNAQESCMNEDCHIFFRHADRFSSLRSFAYSGSYSLYSMPAFEGMVSSFKSITMLILSNLLIMGPLTLPAVEILYLDCRVVDLSEWWFPRLRHVCFGMTTFEDKTYSEALIPGPIFNIHSLLLPDYHPDLEVDEMFWNDHPSLQFLGISIDRFRISDNAPYSHPLRYLHFIESNSALFKVSIQRFNNIVDRIPNLQVITMPVNEDPYEDIYSPNWMELFMEHKRRGIVWRNLEGKEIKVRRKKWKILRLWGWFYVILQLLDLYYWSFWPGLDKRVGWLVPLPAVAVMVTFYLNPHWYSYRVRPLDNTYLM